MKKNSKKVCNHHDGTKDPKVKKPVKGFEWTDWRQATESCYSGGYHCVGFGENGIETWDEDKDGNKTECKH